MRQSQVRPDADGNIRFAVGVGPYDERHSWVGGKPLGTTTLTISGKP